MAFLSSEPSEVQCHAGPVSRQRAATQRQHLKALLCWGSCEARVHKSLPAEQMAHIALTDLHFRTLQASDMEEMMALWGA